MGNFAKISVLIGLLTTFIQCVGAQTCSSEREIIVNVTPSNSYTYNESICLGSDYSGHGIDVKAPKNDTVCKWEVDCDDFTLNLKVCKPAENHIFATICDGETYNKNGFNESKRGEYTRSLISKCSCDSIVTLHLDVISLSVTSLFDKFCVNEPYNGRGYTNIRATKDTVLETKTTQQGCPATILVYLTACLPEETLILDTAERGKRYQKYGYDFKPYNDTLAVLNLKTVSGCDSTVNLRLSVYHDYYIEQESSICRTDSIFWEKEWYKKKGVYEKKYKTVMGLDSIHVLKLDYYPDYLINEKHTVPVGEPYEWHGRTLIGKGIYYDSLKTLKHQCDSVFVLDLRECVPYYFNEEHSICRGDVYDWHKQKLTEKGVYYDKNITVDECDSIYELHLTVWETPEFDVVVSDDYEQEGETDIRQRVEVANVHGGEPPYLCSLDAASYSDEFQFWFTNYMRGDHIYRVMDSNECVTEKTVFYKGVRVPLIIPAFFTPDGKGENETWVIKNLWFYSRSTVEIFDRYGKRVASYSAEENSWDGTYNGHQMPSDDYWYVIRIAETGEKISGHFILRR